MKACKSQEVWAVTLIVALLLAFGSAIYFKGNIPTVPEALADEIQLKPTKEDSGGVDLDTEFVLSGRSPLDVDEIRKNLTVEPSINFTVKRAAGKNNQVLIVPLEPLEPEKIYKFTLASLNTDPLNGLFRQRGFQVVSTLPRHQSTGVPIDTGIEITFSHMNFDNLPDYFRISRKLQAGLKYTKNCSFHPRQA